MATTDTRAVGTTPNSQQAFAFAVLGLHEDLNSAIQLIESRNKTLAGLSESREVWRTVLQPFWHKGEADDSNHLEPEPLFVAQTICQPTESESPFVSITSSGWNVTPEIDMNRVGEFSTGVLAVRASMTGYRGYIRSNHSVFHRAWNMIP
jgi:hypothetical protein